MFNFKVNASACAKVIRYNFIEADSACHYLDYAFCKTVKDQKILNIPNMLFE